MLSHDIPGFFDLLHRAVVLHIQPDVEYWIIW